MFSCVGFSINREKGVSKQKEANKASPSTSLRCGLGCRGIGCNGESSRTVEKPSSWGESILIDTSSDCVDDNVVLPHSPLLFESGARSSIRGAFDFSSCSPVVSLDETGGIVCADAHPTGYSSTKAQPRKKYEYEFPKGKLKKGSSLRKLKSAPVDSLPNRPNEVDYVKSKTMTEPIPAMMYPPHEYNIDLSGLVVGKQIGRGGFGRVYKASMHGDDVALKIITHSASQPAIQVAPELDLLHGICHPNIVHVIGVYQGMEGVFVEDDTTSHYCRASRVSSLFSDLALQVPEVHGDGDGKSDTWVLMEYCDKGSLWDAVTEGSFTTEGNEVQYGKVIEVALEVAFALQHLHEVGIIHGDLKAQNVILQSSKSSPKTFVAKVGDFGLCQTCDRDNANTGTMGTVDHMPPEVLENGKISFATDVYSFAILLYEIIAGEAPFKGVDTPSIILGVVNGMRPPIPDSCPEPLANVMKMCWRENCRQRPTFGEIVKVLKDIMFFPFNEEIGIRVPRKAFAWGEQLGSDEILGRSSVAKRLERSKKWPLSKESYFKERMLLGNPWRHVDSCTSYDDLHCNPVWESFDSAAHELPRFHRVQDM